MSDFRLLNKLQEIRHEALKADWRPELQRIYRLVNEAIDLDMRMHRERLGLEPVDEAGIASAQAIADSCTKSGRPLGIEAQGGQ